MKKTNKKPEADPNQLTCAFRFVHRENSHRDGVKAGDAEACHHVANCAVCGQCSRISNNKEVGHCPGHRQLREHIVTATYKEIG